MQSSQVCFSKRSSRSVGWTEDDRTLQMELDFHTGLIRHLINLWSAEPRTLRDKAVQHPTAIWPHSLVTDEPNRKRTDSRPEHVLLEMNRAVNFSLAFNIWFAIEKPLYEHNAFTARFLWLWYPVKLKSGGSHHIQIVILESDIANARWHFHTG